jgi:CheY-like chemotaxis protein
MRSILLVEDNDDLRELVGALLTRAGYQVFEAEHGQAALELLKALPEHPSLVVLDLMMPVMSGFELLEVLRGSGRWSSLPVIVLSAIADRVRPEGARAYIQKPLNERELLKVVAASLSAQA